jgi:hypothetical protein
MKINAFLAAILTSGLNFIYKELRVNPIEYF